MFSISHLDLPPMDAAGGTVRLPGSKSISNRVLLLAGLAEGETAVHDLLDSDDTRVMLQALAQLGCTLRREAGVLYVRGLAGQLGTKQADLFLGNAGTAMRPLTAALAVLCSLQGGEFTLSGVPRMHERPIGDLVDALRQLGCQVSDLGQPGYPPLKLSGLPGGQLALSRPIRVRGDVSSQFLTALLLALPLAANAQDITIEVTGELISKPYIHITLALLARFGIDVRREGWERFVIPAGSAYRSPGRIHVEGDASSASYFVALGAIAGIDQPIRIEGVGSDSIQGDIRFIDAAQAMGARVDSGPGFIEVRRGSWPLKAIELDCNHIPDAAMTLAAMALYAEGTTRLTGIGSWRVKETDRIAAMACELRKLGAEVDEGPDWITVSAPQTWCHASLHTYDDHRMAMCGSLAAFNALAQGMGRPVTVRIEDPRCVGKTFPDYFETLFSVSRARTADIPVIAIDGPSASGKGTLASQVAKQLGYHFLDSGAIYRACGVAANLSGIAFDDDAALATLASGLDLRFDGEQVWLGDTDITAQVRSEEGGRWASLVSARPAVRQALMNLQLGFRRLPGLVADGRDMGTTVFPDAPMKVFLTASAEQRAERRHKQLISKGFSTTLAQVVDDLKARDARDTERTASPLKAAADAFLLDNSELGIAESVNLVMGEWARRRPFRPA